jgi:hypothetical protein
MTMARVLLACVMTATAAFWVAPVPASAQTASWTPPRTPWGEPDLQGNYSNKYEQGTPFERPAEFEGRRIEEITGAELARIVKERATEVLLNSPFTGGDPVAGNFGGAPAFYDRFDADKGSRPWLVVDPPDGRIPAMSAEGRQASAARAAARAALRRGRGPADSYTDRSLYDRCITRGLPGSMMPANYGNSYRIVQSPGYVAITYEMVHETRVIPVDASPAPAAGARRLSPNIRQYMGDARGHWDGNTLVVVTTNFRDEPVYRGSNPDAVRFIERFTPTAAGKLEWSFTVDDATSWPRPWTFAMPLTRNDQEAVLEYACHEGNLAMAHLLSAARAEEKAPPAQAARESTPGSPKPGTSEGGGLSGAWVDASARGARVNFAGLSSPTRIVISQTAAAVTVETDTGTEGQLEAAVYALDGSERPAPGPIGWDTRARASMQDGKLVVMIKRAIDAPDGRRVFEIRDVYSVDGGVLTLERSQGARRQTLVYKRP